MDNQTEIINALRALNTLLNSTAASPDGSDVNKTIRDLGNKLSEKLLKKFPDSSTDFYAGTF